MGALSGPPGAAGHLSCSERGGWEGGYVTSEPGLLVGNSLWRAGKALEPSRRLLQSCVWMEKQLPIWDGGREDVSEGKGWGEEDTEINLPAVLCKIPLSML